MLDRYDCVSPIDFRYFDPEVAATLSERAFIAYQCRMEHALVCVLRKRGFCSREVEDEVLAACKAVTPGEVYDEEKVTKHDVRALVERIRARVSASARPFIHMTATSFDIRDSATSLRFRDACQGVILPRLRDLILALADLAECEAATPQIGRTHGQHATPITFGFAMAEYVDRLGDCHRNLRDLATRLIGKFSGAVGSYAASALFFPDPLEFEREILDQVSLRPAHHSTQVVRPEPLNRLLSEICNVAAAVGNFACDMRNLQRTEIDEVAEAFDDGQVGSSTMAHKQNPVTFEGIQSAYRIIVSRATLPYLDAVTEHQRDLANSMSARTYTESAGYLVYMLKRALATVRRLRVKRENMLRNMKLTRGGVLAEPLYLLLAALGHGDAHGKSKALSMAARQSGCPLLETAMEDTEFRTYADRMTAEQLGTLADPLHYTGRSEERARAVASLWRAELTA